MTLRETCPNTELFMVQMQENKDQKKLRVGNSPDSEYEILWELLWYEPEHIVKFSNLH